MLHKTCDFGPPMYDVGHMCQRMVNEIMMGRNSFHFVIYPAHISLRGRREKAAVVSCVAI